MSVGESCSVHPAIGEARHHLGIEEHGQRTDGRVRHALADLVDVIGHAIAAPGVGRRVLHTRVVAFQALEHLRVEILPTGQQGLVQRLEHPRLDQGRYQGRVEHHQVVAGAPRQQLALDGFIGIEGVVDHLDPGGLFEPGEGVLADIVRPVVQTQGLVSRLTGLGPSRRQCRTTPNIAGKAVRILQFRLERDGRSPGRAVGVTVRERPGPRHNPIG